MFLFRNLCRSVGGGGRRHIIAGDGDIITGMKAIVLAGGYGKRLMPLTYYKPKPMLPIANRPVIDYAVGRLVAAGISDITFALGYKPAEIAEYVRGYCDVRARVVTDDLPLGTAGSAKRALPQEGDTFVVLSADTVTDCDLTPLIEFHRSSGALVTVETTEVDDLGAFGAIKSDGARITEIAEKNIFYRGKKGIASAGTYVIDRRAFDYVPVGLPFDFARDLFPRLLARGEKLCAYRSEGYWTDVGTLPAYYAANFDALSRSFFMPRHLRRVPNIRRGGNLIADTAIVSGRTVDCIVGDGAIVSCSASIERCIVLQGELVEGRSCGNIIGGDFVVNPALGNVNLRNSQNSANIFRLFAAIEL